MLISRIGVRVRIAIGRAECTTRNKQDACHTPNDNLCAAALPLIPGPDGVLHPRPDMFLEEIIQPEDEAPSEAQGPDNKDIPKRPEHHASFR